LIPKFRGKEMEKGGRERGGRGGWGGGGMSG